MSSQFDALAQMYEDMFDLPLRRHLESYSVLGLLGDLSGKAILDIGCGTGSYCRAIKRAGATTVVGYDTSEGMIAYARGQEAKQPLGIEYTTQPPSDGTFDVVLGVYVLPYATTYAELVDVCSVAANALVPEGRFLTLPVHPDCHGERAYYERYGMRVYDEEPRTDASRIVLELCFGGYDATVSARYWSRHTLQQALAEAGFTGIGWPAFQVSPEGLQAHGAAFWSPYLRRPHAALVSCNKSTPNAHVHATEEGT